MGGSSSVQVVMLGLENSGKTTLLYRLKFGQYTSAIPTIGFNCEKISVTEGKAKGVTFTFWDIGGKDNMRPLWKSYLRSADGILFVLDSNDSEGMDEARMELTRLVKMQNPSGIPTIVVANKQDLPDALDGDGVSRALGVHEWKGSGTSSHSGGPPACQVFPTCAVTGEGLQEIMDSMFEMIQKWRKTKSRNSR